MKDNSIFVVEAREYLRARDRYDQLHDELAALREDLEKAALRLNECTHGLNKFVDERHPRRTVVIDRTRGVEVVYNRDGGPLVRTCEVVM